AENTIVYRYNPFSEEIFSKDSVGKIIETTRDFKGRALKEEVKTSAKVTDLSQKVNFSILYNYKVENGNTKVTKTDGNKNITVMEYDNLDRLIRETTKIKDSKGVLQDRVKSYEYFANDLVLREYDWFGNNTKSKYDVFGRVVEKVNGNGEVIEKLEYYKNGTQKSSTDAMNNVIKYNYDNRKRLTQETNGENHTTSYEYNSKDNTVKITEPKGNKVTRKYDLRSRITSVDFKNATSDVVTTKYSYTYDDNNNLLKVIDGENRIKEYSYNARNLLKSSTDKIDDKTSYTESYTYEANGALKTKLDKEEITISYKNDILGREITESSQKDTIVTRYDNNGNELIVQNNSDTIIRNYDEINRVKAKRSHGKLLTFT
ncbi:MAG: hypothetical protein ACRC7N_09585, partial [Clostridium sp.]